MEKSEDQLQNNKCYAQITKDNGVTKYIETKRSFRNNVKIQIAVQK